MIKPEVPQGKAFVEFNLQLNAVWKNAKEHSIEFELDLNPFMRIFEKKEAVFKPKQMKEIFQFMADFMGRLEQLKKYEKIDRVVHKVNSPALTNASFLSSYNGDLPPSRKGGNQ